MTQGTSHNSLGPEGEREGGWERDGGREEEGKGGREEEGKGWREGGRGEGMKGRRERRRDERREREMEGMEGEREKERDGGREEEGRRDGASSCLPRRLKLNCRDRDNTLPRAESVCV